jgi:hypothetical protein
MIYGTDWGAYLGSSHEINLPFKALLDAGLCDFFICKGAMNDYDQFVNSVQNIQAARTAGIPVVGTYYWHFPSWLVSEQIDYYSKAIALEKPDFIALDMEDAQGLASLAVSNSAKALCAGLHANFPKLPFFVYTSWNFIQGSTPDSNKWLGNYLPWPASWPDWGTPHTDAQRKMTLAQIRQYPLLGWKPLLPDAWSDKSWVMWQFDTWQIPAGMSTLYSHQYDWDVYNGSLDDLKKLCGLTVIPKPPLTYEQKVDILVANHPELFR